MRTGVKWGLICYKWASKPLEIMVSPYKMTEVFNKFTGTSRKQNVIFKRKEHVYIISHCRFYPAVLLPRSLELSFHVWPPWKTKGKIQSVVLVIFSSVYFLSQQKYKINFIYPVSIRILNSYIVFFPYFLSYCFILWYNYEVEYVQPAENLPFTVKIISSWLQKYLFSACCW